MEPLLLWIVGSGLLMSAIALVGSVTLVLGERTLRGVRMVRRGPFEDPGIAARYESWYETEGRRAGRLERRLLGDLLDRLRPWRSLVEVGCGTGHFTRWFARRTAGRVVGLDLSMEMLLQAVSDRRVRYLRGDACALPFPDRAFDVVAFVTTLEFVGDPRRALAEAWRVARRGLLLGVLDRRSLLGLRLERKGGPIWSGARLLTVRELRRLVIAAAPGHARIVARTTLWPLWPESLPVPWGGFIGLAAVGADGGGGERVP